MNNAIKSMLNSKDDYGNSLACDFDGNITLRLATGEKRMIGRVEGNAEGGVTYIKRIKDNHIFKKTNSLAVNWIILESLADNDVITYVHGKIAYTITKERAIENGSFLWFKNPGFERQYFIPIEKWTRG